uniref:G-protein coupled receptors family 1 profile domain-containing protein n=1 Tax=Haplochromis burtoni TaxID=8153 RepID=A0A3Q2VFG2_HAPBU
MTVESDSDHGPECLSVCNKSATLTGQGPPVLVACLVLTFFGFIMLVDLKMFCCTVIVTDIPCVPGFQVTAQATCVTLSAMSVDCCYVTLYPLQSLRHRTPRRALVGYCLFGPQTYCNDVFPSAHLQRAFTIYSFLAVYLLPLLTITVCYAIMLKRMGQPSMNPIGSGYQCALILHSQLKIWGHCMSCSNSSVNPFVYAFTGNNFRKAFKHAFPAILLWRSRGRVRVGNTDAEAPKGEAEMHFLSSGP